MCLKTNLIHTERLQPDTGRKIVPVFFQRYNNISLKRVRFRLDSGADISTIRKPDLNKLGYSMNWIEKNMKSADIKLGVADNTARDAFYVEIPLMYFMEKDFYDFKVFAAHT